MTISRLFKSFLFFLPILILAYFNFGFAFGCGLAMDHSFPCRVLLPFSFYLSIGSFISFIFFAISNFKDNEEKSKRTKILFIVYSLLLVLAFSTFIFAGSYNKIPSYIKMQYFEGQTVESCSSNGCLMEIFMAQIYAGKDYSIDICAKISDAHTKANCLLIYDALIDGDFYACLNITSPLGLTYVSMPYDSNESSVVVWNSRIDRDFCYKRVAFKEKNEYVKASPYVDILANVPWNAYDQATCSAETRLAAKNYCFYVTGRCGNIISAPIMQEDCRAYYLRFYPEQYNNKTTASYIPAPIL